MEGLNMKKLLLTLAMGAMMTSCMTTTYDPYGYDSYGNVVYYDVYDDYGYNYIYDEAVIVEITNRMVVQMRLSSWEAQRLLDLNRRYYYLFNRYPSYSWGYYAHPLPGYARPGYGGRGPGYGAPPRGYRDPYMRIENGRATMYNVNTRRGSDNRVMMTSKQMDKMADKYDKEIRKLVGSDSYNTFRTQTSNRSVTYMANPGTSGYTGGNGNAVVPNNNTRQGVGTSTRTTTTIPATSNDGGRVRSSGTNTTPSTGTATQPSTSSSRMNQRTGNTNTQGTVNSRTNSTGTRQQTTTTQRQQGTSTRQQTTTGSSSRTRTRTNTTSTTPQVNTRTNTTSSSTTTTPTTSRSNNTNNNQNTNNGGGARRR